MEVNVYNINGEATGRKVTLNESIFGIEHINLRKEVKLAVLPAKLVVKRAVGELDEAI